MNHEACFPVNMFEQKLAKFAKIKTSGIASFAIFCEFLVAINSLKRRTFPGFCV